MTERYRSRNVNYSFPITSRLWNETTQTLYQEVSSSNVHSKGETMTDEVSPGYFAAKRRGQFLPVNPMVQTKGDSFYDPGVVQFEIYYNGVLKYTHTWTGAPAATCYFWHYSSNYNPSYGGSYPSWPDSNVVLTEALANARTRGFDVLTFLAEFRKTLTLIKGFRDRTLKRAEKVADSLGKVSDPASAFAETWLESRYGWRILLFDIAAINEAIDKLNTLSTPFIRGYSEDEAVANHTVQTYSPAAQYFRRYSPYSQAALWETATFVVTQSATRNVRAGVLLEAVIQDILDIDPLVTGWEIIPFSFILDWFINIGSVIEAYSPFAQENLLGAWTKETEVVQTLISAVPTTSGNPTSGWYYKLITGAGTYQCGINNTTVNRQPATPSASLSFNLKLDELKIIDLVSIFLGRYAKILGGIRKSNRI